MLHSSSLKIAFIVFFAAFAGSWFGSYTHEPATHTIEKHIPAPPSYTVKCPPIAPPIQQPKTQYNFRPIDETTDKRWIGNYR